MFRSRLCDGIPCMCVFVILHAYCNVYMCSRETEGRIKRETHHQPGHESEEKTAKDAMSAMSSCLLSNLTPAHSKIYGEFRLLILSVSYIFSIFRYMFSATKLQYCSFLFDFMSKTCLAGLITTTFLNN